MPPVSCALAGWRMRLIPNGWRSEPGRPSGRGHAAATCLIDARFHAKLVSHKHSAWRSCKVCCCQVRHPVAFPGSFLCVRRVSFQNHLSPARTTPAYEMGPVHAPFNSGHDINSGGWTSAWPHNISVQSSLYAESLSPSCTKRHRFSLLLAQTQFPRAAPLSCLFSFFALSLLHCPGSVAWWCSGSTRASRRGRTTNASGAGETRCSVCSACERVRARVPCANLARTPSEIGVWSVFLSSPGTINSI